MHVRIDTRDLLSFARDIENAAAQVGPETTLVVKTVAHEIEGTAKAIVPVGETGNLKGSISTSIDADGLGAEIGPTVEYGHYVEEGTSRMSGQPYMAPALAKHEPTFHKAMARLRDTLL